MGLYVNPGNGALEDGLLQRENVLPPSGKGFSDVVYLPIQNADCPAKHTCVIERLKK